MSVVDPIVMVEQKGNICCVTLNRPAKRNALSAATYRTLHAVFRDMPDSARVVVLCGAGENFCAGLDLSEHQFREPFESVTFAQSGHDVFNAIQFGSRPVVVALHGAVIGGGLELACCAHVRVADKTTFYQLPEARRGIFVGGGATVRVSRIIGDSRLLEMMLTGRKLDAHVGERLGLSHYLTEPGEALETAMEVARTIAENATIPNYLIMQAIPRIADMAPEQGLFTESIAQAISLTSADAKDGIQAFLNRKKAAR
jgi:(methylthio)acryloyl-CoA hydratase